MLDETKIGTTYNATYNSVTFTGVVENDPKKFKFYKKIGLNVFKKKEKVDRSKEGDDNAKRKSNTRGKDNDK